MRPMPTAYAPGTIKTNANMGYTIDFQQVRLQLEATPHGQKEALKQMICQDLNISRDTLHREIRKLSGPRKQLAQRITERKVHIAMMVVEMKQRGMDRSLKEHEMATRRCLDRLARQGSIRKGEISASHCNRIIRDVLGWREPATRVRFSTQYALQEVQMDFSTSKYFQIVGYDEARGDWKLKASGRKLYYKENPHKLKLILGGAIDHYSRLFLVRSYPGCAESTIIGMGLMNWMLTRPEDDHLLHHLPFRVGVDNGGPWKSQEFTHVRSALDLDVRMIPPEHKESLGMIENHWQNVWRWELEWSEDYPAMYLSEYNELLHHEAIAEQALAHPELSGTRRDIYQQSILQNRPRTVDTDLMQIATRTWLRRVGADLSISVEGTKFKVPQYAGSTWTNGKQVRVYQNMSGEWLGELVEAYGKPFVLQPFQATPYGEFTGSPKQTFRDRIKADIAAGYSMYKDVNRPAAERVDPETGEIIESGSAVLRPAANPAQVRSPFTAERAPDAFDSVFEAKSWIGKQLEPYGISFGDVSGVFDGLLAGRAPEKEPIAERLGKLVDHINQHTKTGTL